jgi:hypothetical protein
MASLVSDEMSPSLTSAAAIEPGVGWRCINARQPSTAEGPPAARDASSASTCCACVRSIAAVHGPAKAPVLPARKATAPKKNLPTFMA